jgi:hypothetical protein
MVVIVMVHHGSVVGKGALKVADHIQAIAAGARRVCSSACSPAHKEGQHAIEASRLWLSPHKLQEGQDALLGEQG